MTRKTAFVACMAVTILNVVSIAANSYMLIQGPVCPGLQAHVRAWAILGLSCAFIGLAFGAAGLRMVRIRRH